MSWFNRAMVRHGNGNRSVVLSNVSTVIIVRDSNGDEQPIEVPDRFVFGVVFDNKTFKAYIYRPDCLVVESDFSDVYEFLNGDMNLLTFLYIGE